MNAKHLCAAVLLCATAGANDDFTAGTGFAKSIKEQGASAVAGMDPAASIPGFTASPPEAARWGGVTDPSNNMDNDGNRAIEESEAGRAITDSILNNPKEPILPEAPFVSAGFDAQDDAGRVTDGSFEGCGPVKKEQTVISSHVCERDVNATRTCKRTASITGHWEETTEQKIVTVTGQSLRFALSGDIYSASAPVPAGRVLGASVTYSWNRDLAYGGDAYVLVVNALGGHVVMQAASGTASLPAGQQFGENARLTLSLTNKKYGSGQWAASLWPDQKMRYAFTLTLTLAVKARRWVPEVVWSGPCALAQEPGVTLVGSVCSVPGGAREVVVEGVKYPVHSDCWEYTDTYRTQEADAGTCGPYAANPACTVATRACAFSLDGVCLHENVTYTCETKTEAEGTLCGGEFICADGACAEAEAGKSHSFQHAISQLAAVAAAGEDAAEMNEANVRAFTGEARTCRKAAAGFNNCCAGGGWGSDAGLAHCSSEEKALGEARERKLTVEVGEYCDRSVLGVCLQKKRSFCLFDSKLAQIVQQQGRQWQLGAGFGDAKSPDCRGITIDELQRIDFSRLDFTNFYADLENGAAIPEDGALLERAKEIIARQQQQQQQKGKP